MYNLYLYNIILIIIYPYCSE